MLLSYFKRYGLVACAVVYTAALVALHALGKFPAPGPDDVSRLAGDPALIFEGRVITFPQTRWGQTRFGMEGRALSHAAYRGRIVVTLRFPLEDLAPGETLRVRGWLSRPRGADARRSFDERAYWAGFRAYAVLRVWSPEALARLQGSGHTSWRQRAWDFHQRFKQFWFDHLPEDEAALLSCITMGSRGILPVEIKNKCIRAGVYHILVVSGQKMALIIALGVAFLQLIRVPRRRAFWVCCGPVLFYASAVGADPPVVRAQLSFGATASLLALWPWVRELGRIRSRFLRWLAEAGAVSLAVNVGVWPLLVYYFHQISLIGFVANWTIFPFSGALLIYGLVLGTWGVLSPGSVPFFLLRVMHQAMEGTLWTIEKMNDWEWAAFPLPAPSWAVCGVYYALLICILWKIRHVKNASVLQQSRRRL